MDIDKPIQLRPRFEYPIDVEKKILIDRIKQLRTEYKSKFRFKIVGEHIYIHHQKRYEKMYTPHLHLEIIEQNTEKDKTIIKGIYSPNAVYWTFFMFLHFAIGILFIGCLIMAYTKSVLKESYELYQYLSIGLIVIWIVLYVFARINRKRGLSQAYSLELIFKEWINFN